MRSFMLLAVLAAACSSSPDSSADAAPLQPDADPDFHVPAGYSLVPFLSDDPVRSFTEAGDATDPDTDYMMVMETDVGIIVIDLHEQDTPITTNSFVWLTLHHFYEGVAFHRVIEGFVAQGGDPRTAGGGGNGGPGYGYGLEIVPSLSYDSAGVVGVANMPGNPNSNGSQFFITFAPQPALDGGYTVFGRVVEGEDVLPLIVRGEPPADPTRMTQVYIVEKPI